MSRPTVHWRLETAGPDTPETWIDTALAAEQLGLDGLELPGPEGDLRAAVIGPVSRRLRFLIGLQPGTVLPATAAQRVQGLQALIGDRVQLLLDARAEGLRPVAEGDCIHPGDGVARASEFVQLLRAIGRGRSGGPVQHSGRHYRVESGGLWTPWLAEPALHLDASSPAVERLGLDTAQVLHLLADGPQRLQERVLRLQQAAPAGPALGLRLDLVLGPSRPAAREAAEQLGLLAPEAERVLPGAPALWPGRPGGHGPGVTFVGTPGELLDHLAAWQALGLRHFRFGSPAGASALFSLGDTVLPHWPRPPQRPLAELQGLAR